jgi:hypothetical protein
MYEGNIEHDGTEGTATEADPITLQNGEAEGTATITHESVTGWSLDDLRDGQ